MIDKKPKKKTVAKEIVVTQSLNKKVLSEEDQLLKKLLTDFPTYLKYAYTFLNLPSPTPLQNRIATILGRNDKRLILQAARGVGKSWITAIYASWRLLRNPNEKILIVSATVTKAIEISSFVRRLFTEVDILKHLEPQGDDRDSVIAFDVHGASIAIAPSVAAGGITGQLAGKRASLIIADDIEIPNNSATQKNREKLIESVKEFESLLIPDMPSTIVFLGTPQSMESVYAKLPYKLTILPAMVPANLEIYNGNIDEWIMEQGPAGTPTDKIRFTKEILDLKLAGTGMSNFQLQFMLDTSLSDADKFPLKQKDLMVMPLDRTKAPLSLSYTSNRSNILEDLNNVGFTGDRFYSPGYSNDELGAYETIVMAIDPSGLGNDETAYAIIGVKNGFVFLLDSGAVENYSDEDLLTLALKAKEYKVDTIVPEKNMGNGMFGVLLEKVLIQVYPCSIEKDFTSKGQKEMRIINNLLPLMRNHQLVVDYDLVHEDTTIVEGSSMKTLVNSLFYQMTHITRDRHSLEHDDRIDALAIACEYVKDSVIIDANEILRRYEEQEMKDWLEQTIYASSSSSKASFLKKK